MSPRRDDELEAERETDEEEEVRTILGKGPNAFLGPFLALGVILVVELRRSL